MQLVQGYALHSIQCGPLVCLSVLFFSADLSHHMLCHKKLTYIYVTFQLLVLVFKMSILSKFLVTGLPFTGLVILHLLHG